MTEHLTTTFVAKVMSERGYRVIAGPETPVTGGAADSRKVQAGDLFTAFPGENVDGNAFVAQALENGAAAAICERAPEGEWPGRTIVVAPDATKAVGELAHAWRKEWGGPVVGITGTVGKTTAKGLTATALSTRFRTHRSEGNFNSREGLPLALMSLRRDHEVSVLEMGMDSPGEMDYLCAIAEPHIGVVLNIGLTHISKLGSIEAIAREKLALVRNLPESGIAIINIDDPRIAEARDSLRCRVIPFGEEVPPGGLTYSSAVDLGLSGSEFRVHLLAEYAQAHSPLPGLHTIPAALCAIAVCYAMGMSLPQATAALASADLREGRMQVRQSDTGATILDDRYNSSPASLAGALLLLRGREGRRIALLGRMAELGEYEETEHEKIGVLAAECCDLLFAVGLPCKAMVEAAHAAGLAAAYWFEDKREAAVAVRERLTIGDTVLVKASRSQEFETIIPFLEGAA